MMKKIGKHDYKSYLAAVYSLTRKKDTVSLEAVAAYLDEPKKRARIAAARMKKAGDVKIDKNGDLRLTEEGRRKAASVYDRRRYFQRILTKAGVDADMAAKEAQKLGDAISQEAFEQLRLYTLLKHANKE